MNRISNCFAIAPLIFSAVALADPVKIIYDTDMGNDVDDALALAMLHSLWHLKKFLNRTKRTFEYIYYLIKSQPTVK